ncbi:unnamed protein product [Macrosiphum euphorbiae]|uniref:Reverse transcriptase domain-containing protein n=1 Tax=Macrosiphum euphorbiae TaxID=13131 RepID=A0AAV0X8A7_9HEMI|nr:unnamed protein product [Macrosiphum euphorbiae]
MQFDIENLNELSSDHNPILLNVYNQSFPQPFKTITLINWKNFSVNLHESITNPNPLINTTTDLDQAAIEIAELFKSALSVNSTTRICNPHKDLPQAIKIEITKKKRLRRIWQHTRNPDAKRRLNIHTEVVRELLRVHREEEWNNLLDNLKPNDPKVYKIARSLTHKQAATEPLLGPNGLIFDQESKSELFANSLETQFTCPAGDIMTTSMVKEKLKILNQSYPPTIQHITPNEVKSIIKTLPRKKAPGPDGIPNTALRHASNRTILHLTKIFNSCIRLSHFPNVWKHANVVMIPKPGKNKSDPANHRPISLLNTMSKLFEILILKRLKSYVSPFIRPEQYAFRPEHSTTIQLTKLVDDLAITFNRKERTAAIFLDFEKAFDKVWHQGVLYKLLTLSVPVQLVNLIKVFLTDRTFSVKLSTTSSSPRNIKAGVPQGSCLSPLLFSIYINDIPTNPGIKINLFADDTMFFYSSMSKKFAMEKIQSQLNRSLSWLERWRISINPKKTVAILFGDKTSKDLEELLVNNHPVPWSQQVKYLGITIDSRLTFHKHVLAIQKKTRQIRAALYPLLNSRSHLSLRQRLTLHKLYIIPNLTYAGPAWGALISNRDWRRLEAVQNISLRTITASPWFIRNTTIRNSSNIDSLQNQIIRASKIMFNKTKTSNHQHIKSIGRSKATIQWKRKRPENLM